MLLFSFANRFINLSNSINSSHSFIIFSFIDVFSIIISIVLLNLMQILSNCACKFGLFSMLLFVLLLEYVLSFARSLRFTTAFFLSLFDICFSSFIKLLFSSIALSFSSFESGFSIIIMHFSMLLYINL